MVNESTFWVASSVVLLLIVIGLIGYIIAMKRIVRGIKKELPRTRDIDYNKQIKNPNIYGFYNENLKTKT